METERTCLDHSHQQMVRWLKTASHFGTTCTVKTWEACLCTSGRGQTLALQCGSDPVTRVPGGSGLLSKLRRTLIIRLCDYFFPEEVRLHSNSPDCLKALYGLCLRLSRETMCGSHVGVGVNVKIVCVMSLSVCLASSVEGRCFVANLS